jgi:hypothetical protein
MRQSQLAYDSDWEAALFEQFEKEFLMLWLIKVSR